MMDRPAPPTSTALLVVHHLAQIRADLEDAKATMVARLQSLASRLPQDDPDREVLVGCIRDLQATTPPPAATVRTR